MDLPPGEWSALLVGHQWPSLTALMATGEAATSRKTIGAAYETYSETLGRILSGPLAEQEGVTAEATRQLFQHGQSQSRELSAKNLTKSSAYQSASQWVSSLRDDLTTIAEDGNSEIRTIINSKMPEVAKIGKITTIVAKAQIRASTKAGDRSANLFNAIQSVLDKEEPGISAREFARAHGVDLDRAFATPNEDSIRDSVSMLFNDLKKSGGAQGDSTTPLGQKLFSDGQDKTPLAASEPAPGAGSSKFAWEDGLKPAPPTDTHGAPDVSQQFFQTGQSGTPPVGLPQTSSAAPSTSSGPVSSAGIAGGTSMPSPNLSSSPSNLTGSSPCAPANALSPEGFAQNFNSGAQAGGPMSSGAEGLSSTAAHAMQPQAPTHPESMAAPPAYTTPSAGAPLFETAHATPTYDTAQAPVAPPADATQTYVAAPAAQAPAMSTAAGPAAPAGPLPAYGADLRPAATTAPAAPPPTPAAAAPASAPVHPSSGAQLGQPAVVRQTPAAAAAATPPTGITESALASTATGAVAGAGAAMTQAQQRLQRLLDSVARQEPQLRWAIGERDDGTTVLTTDLASGWIPPHIQIPTGIKILAPRARTRTLEALLGETTLTATYAPGEYLPPAEDTDPVSMSIRARDTDDVDELGWELAQATKWRDGLPRLALTLAKAASTGTGYLDSEVELLREHLATVANQVLGDYPDHVDTAKVGNWQLLATIDALIKNEKTAANYHFAWFQALSLALKGDGHR